MTLANAPETEGCPAVVPFSYRTIVSFPESGQVKEAAVKAPPHWHCHPEFLKLKVKSRGKEQGTHRECQHGTLSPRIAVAQPVSGTLQMPVAGVDGSERVTGAAWMKKACPAPSCYLHPVHSLVMSISSLLCDSPVANAICLLGLWLLAAVLYLYPYRERTVPFRNLRGPASPSLLWGSTNDVFTPPPTSPLRSWVDEYGPTMRYKTILGTPALITADVRAIATIFARPYEFSKPSFISGVIDRVFGVGLLSAEGHVQGASVQISDQGAE